MGRGRQWWTNENKTALSYVHSKRLWDSARLSKSLLEKIKKKKKRNGPI